MECEIVIIKTLRRTTLCGATW